jgi:alpha/beta superfamily hydrolase
LSFRPPAPVPVAITGPVGALEGLLEDPTGEDSTQGPAHRFGVVCHPHPLQGGTLQNKVVHTVARVFQELGVPTLRFNFRGVGASEGTYDEGRGEVDDALAVLAYGRARWMHAEAWLAGFSFGSLVALAAARRLSPRLLVCVAPPVERLDPADAVGPACPWLIVQGEADEIVDARGVRAFAARVVPSPTLTLLPGVGHFFHGRLHELHDAVMEFCKTKTR